jgi:hypothetical protein
MRRLFTLLTFICALSIGNTWADSGKLTITRENFPAGALAYNATDIFTSTATGGEVISGEGDLYSTATQTTLQTRNTNVSTMYHNTVAMPGPITKITLKCATGTVRTYTAYMNENAAITAAAEGTAKGTIAPAVGETASLELNAADNWKYFWLDLAGGASTLDFIEIEYETVGGTEPDTRVVIAQWNGYTQGAPPADGLFKATEGIPANKNVATLARDASTGITYTVNTDLIAASNAWDGADATEKYWTVNFSTTGCEDLTLTSGQRGSNTGPKDFKIQYRIGSESAWTDLSDGAITVANDNYISGIKEDLPLPAALNDKASVSLRWLATSAVAINNSAVASGGVNRLEVIIKGLSDGGGTPVLSDDATLKSLTVGETNILKPNTVDYTYELPEGTTEIPTIVAEINHENATIENTALPTLPGITDGTNNKAIFVITAEDGTTTKTYTITFSIKVAVEGQAFLETCGESAPTSNPRPSPAEYTDWDNQAPVTFEGNTDLRATTTLNSHVWFAATTTANPERNLIISGINTAGKENLNLSFEVAANATGDAENIHVKVKDLGTNTETVITVPSTPITTANKYVAVNNLPGIPATSNLQITFYTNETNTVGYRLDNILITEGTITELSENNNLKSLTVSKGTMRPEFSPAVVSYFVVLPENDTAAPSVTYEVEDPTATAVLTEPESVPGSATIVVTAENGDKKTYTVNYSNAVPADVWMETFETENTKNSYAVGDYQGTAALWEVAGVVRNDDSNDKKNGLMSARLRDPNASNPDTHSYILMKEDKANGAGLITLSHGMYSNHTNGAYTLEVSNNGGATWNAYQAEVEEVPAELTSQNFVVNVEGNIRIKITKQSAGTSSINIDDIRITDYTPDGIGAVGNSSVLVHVVGNTLFVKNIESGAKISVYDITGKLIKNTNTHEITLPAKGIYIVRVNSEVFKVINH